MKYKAVVVALIMVFIIATPYVSIESDLDADAFDDYHPAYDSLSAAQKTLYTNLDDAVASFKTSVKVSGLTMDETWDVYYAFYSDFPEYYWFQDSYSIFYNTSTGQPTEIKSKVPLDSDALLKGIEEIGDNIEKKYRITGNTAAEVLQSIQLNIAFNTVYDLSTENCGNMYGVFVEGKAKCDGYSEALQFICKANDIPCITLTGDVETEGRHAWNAVQLENGRWYYIDATWDDPKCPMMVEYDYFLIGSDTETPTGTFRENRVADRDFGVKVSSTAYTFDPYPDGYWMDSISVSYESLSESELKNKYYYWDLHDVQIRVDEDARKALVSAMLQNGSEYWNLSIRTYKSSTHVESMDPRDYDIRMYLDDTDIDSLSSLGLSGLIEFVPPESHLGINYVSEYYTLDGSSFHKGGSLMLKDLGRFTVGYVERDWMPLLVIVLLVVIAISLFILLRRRSARKATAEYQEYVPQYSSPEPPQQPAGRSIKYCPQCGSSLYDEDRFCINCGKSIDRSRLSGDDDETNEKQ